MPFITQFNGLSKTAEANQSIFALSVKSAELQLKMLKGSSAHSANEKKQAAIKGATKIKSDIERMITSVNNAIDATLLDVASAKKVVLQSDLDASAKAIVAMGFIKDPNGARRALKNKNTLSALSLFPNLIDGIDSSTLQEANENFVRKNHPHIQDAIDTVNADRLLLDSMATLNDSLAKQYAQFSAVDIPELI
jgi:hypothetical protein